MLIIRRIDTLNLTITILIIKKNYSFNSYKASSFTLGLYMSKIVFRLILIKIILNFEKHIKCKSLTCDKVVIFVSAKNYFSN